MRNYKAMKAQPEYERDFWNLMRGSQVVTNALMEGSNTNTDTYDLPAGTDKKLEKLIAEESVFRSNATLIHAYKSENRIFAKDNDDLAQFIPEGGIIPIYEGMNDFNISSIDSHKLASFVKLDTDFVTDAAFPIEDYLTKRFARNFADAEDKAYINGSGNEEPAGILDDAMGAEIGKETSSLTYDDVISLYFNVKARYRKHGMWLMNDKTALVLRTLKDNDGNYLWNQSDNTILGKPVVISEYMPDISAGGKPIAFGDFSYYWIILRKSVSIRCLTEKFAANNQTGYLALEFLDGRLIRRDAIKLLKVTA